MLSHVYKSFRGVFAHIRPEQKKGALICLGIMLTLAFMEIIAAGLVAAIAQKLTSPSGKAGLVFLAIICAVLFLVKSAVALTDSYMQSRWIQNVVVDFKQRIMERYTRMDYTQQIRTNSGHALALLNNDIDIWMRIGLQSFGIMLSESCVFIVITAFLLYLQPMTTLALMVIFGVIGLVFLRVLSPRFRRWGKVNHQTAEAGAHQALQIFQSYKDILIFGKSAYFIELFQKQSIARAQVAVKSAMAGVLPRIGIESLFILFFAGVVITYSMNGQSTADLTAILGAYLYAGFRLLPGLNRMLVQLNNVRISEASLEKIAAELNAPAHENIYVSAPGLTFEKSINIENVNYRYPGTDRDVLKNINLEIRKGEFIGIVGETGSGKSTLFHLALGLMTPSNGSVTIDGKYPTTSHEWHSKIGYAAQNFHLIDGSVADNIAFGLSESERDNARVENCIKEAKLEGFISRLPEGLGTSIGEKGVLISGGERQRIALARALYRQPEILMIDEATSALDLETEASIMQTIARLKDRGLTIIAVTHRMETLKSADRIILIENGQIKEEKERLKNAS